MHRIPRRVFMTEYTAEAVRLAGAVGLPTAARQFELVIHSSVCGSTCST